MGARLFVVVMLLTSPALGGKKGSAPAAAQPPAITNGPQALAQLQELYRSLEYDQVIPLAEALLARDDLSQEQRLEVYRLQGSARAIVEDPVDAERPFRLLLRARPDYDLPADTPPKILAVFRKVQTEEKALANQLRDVERARLIANLRLTGEPPREPQGGRPLRFSYRVRDTAGVVETMRLQYRRAGQKAFSSLALERGDDGAWRGVIPGEFTADERGFTLEYVVETADRDGVLLTEGSAAAPRALAIAAGQVPTTAFKPVPRAVFFTSAGVTAALGLAAGATGLAFHGTQAAYRQRAALDVTALELEQLASRGEAFALATNVLLVSAAVTLVATLVLWPLTRFFDD
ncbi:MAG: hypothetical protein MUC96_00305 [Myxococcaceae bacterium]|jgi:hypothetical protein|nr:hypothetical protein [Myxococcaceae bacterium]